MDGCRRVRKGEEEVDTEESGFFRMIGIIRCGSCMDALMPDDK